MHKGFWWRNLRERDQLEEPVVDGRLLKFFFRKWDLRVPLINLVQERDTGPVLVNTVMNIQVL